MTYGATGAKGTVGGMPRTAIEKWDNFIDVHVYERTR